MLTMSTLIQFFSLIASFGVIGMTYHVYRMSHKHTLIDNNLKQIVTLYYKIDDDFKTIQSLRMLKNDDYIKHLYRKIETNAVLMRYYIKSFPIQYEEKMHFEELLASISHSPEIARDYDKLTEEFKKFCKNIDETNAMCIIKRFNR